MQKKHLAKKLGTTAHCAVVMNAATGAWLGSTAGSTDATPACVPGTAALQNGIGS